MDAKVRSALEKAQQVLYQDLQGKWIPPDKAGAVTAEALEVDADTLAQLLEKRWLAECDSVWNFPREQSYRLTDDGYAALMREWQANSERGSHE